MNHLDFYERKMLSTIKTPYRQYMVPIILNHERFEINTLETMLPEDQLGCLSEFPLVMLHGFGGGLGVFVKNIDDLAARFKVYSFDGLGCGKSSRPAFPSTPEPAEKMFVESIEAWRKAMKIDKMILLGHSFGGYQAIAYALRYPEHIKHLILADPWGFPVRPKVVHHRIPLWLRIMSGTLYRFPPFTLLRALGPLGPRVLHRARPDMGEKFADVLNDPIVLYQYIYHLNVQKPSAELGFAALTHPYGWAKRPMINRVDQLHPEVPMTFILGHHSMMDNRMGSRTKELRPRSRVDIHIIPHSGHHLYCEQHKEFNDLVVRVGEFLEPRITLV